MTKKRLLAGILFPLIILLTGSAVSAQKSVSGKVTDAKNGQPLAGASVLIKGTKEGANTAADGTFKLTVSSSAKTLVVSSVGYEQKEVAISDGIIEVSLNQLSASLEEIVVIGYGTRRKKDLTGSITTINAKDFQKGSINTPEQLISGKVPGVVITSNGGAPGAGSTIRIRGGSSLNASNDPLIVIDGVPVSNDAVSGTPNGLALINPNDIETFTILKDASATAIYGNRASNGVIIITTKKGKSGGKLVINFSSVNSESVKINQVDVLNGDQIRAIVDSLGNDAQKALLGASNTNWQNQIYRHAFGTDNNLSLSGGIKKLPYRLSLEYLDQDGILKTNNLKRTSVALNISPTLLNNNLHIDINLKGSSSDNRFPSPGAIGSSLNMDPTQPVYSDNKYGGYFEWLDASDAPIQQAIRNPLGLLELYSSKSTVQRSIGSIQLDYKLPFFPALRANLNAGYDLSKSKGDVFIPDNAASNYAQGGYANHYSQYKRNELFDFYLNYAKDIKTIDSRVDVTAGYEYQDFFRGSPAYPVTNAAKTVTLSLPLADSVQNTLVSFYGRLNYTFKNRYLLTATVRQDGSSRFSPDNRWGTFPSVAFAWRIKEESFLKSSRTFSELKLRLGYGITGQQDIGPYYPYLPIYTLSSLVAQYPFGNTYYPTYRAEAYDPNIKWEETKTYNIGLDYGFLNGKIFGSIDVYDRKTSDLLVDIPTAAGANLSNHVFTNVGDLENKGVEFALNVTPVATNTFNWTAGFNITYNKNKITKLSKLATDTTAGILTGNIGGGTGNSIQILSVGYPTYTFYAYKQVYDQSGNPVEGVYSDVNKNPSDLFYRYKSGNPDVTLGFSSQLSYQKLTLSFVLRGSFGNYLYNNVSAGGTLNSVLNTQGYIGNTNASYLDTRFKNSQYYSDYYIENASFLRMDNLALGYDFGKVFNKAVNLRLSAVVQNVFVITKYKGLDPEIYGGIDNNIYPRPRIFSFGINADF